MLMSLLPPQFIQSLRRGGCLIEPNISDFVSSWISVSVYDRWSRVYMFLLLHQTQCLIKPASQCCNADIRWLVWLRVRVETGGANILFWILIWRLNIFNIQWTHQCQKSSFIHWKVCWKLWIKSSGGKWRFYCNVAVNVHNRAKMMRPLILATEQ